MTETGNERNGGRMWSEQFGGFPRLGTVRTPRRSKREPADSWKVVHLCRSYTALLARSSAILKSFPIPIVTGQITVRSAKRIVRCGRTASTCARCGYRVDAAIRVRRYFCQCCRRTVSLLPEFGLPYLARIGEGFQGVWVRAISYGRPLRARTRQRPCRSQTRVRFRQACTDRKQYPCVTR